MEKGRRRRRQQKKEGEAKKELRKLKKKQDDRAGGYVHKACGQGENKQGVSRPVPVPVPMFILKVRFPSITRPYHCVRAHLSKVFAID